MPNYAAYVICATPRSGSTLLCEMLAATGVAGRPNSFFRQQSIAEWADDWGVDRSAGVDDTAFDQAYIPAMLVEGNNGTGIFGLRLMRGSVDDAITRLRRVNGGLAELAAQFETSFGPTLYIHLSRQDKVAQAVSFVRAKQSGLWHLAADGSVYEGVAVPQPNVYDAPSIAALFNDRVREDAAWEDFFARHAIEPIRLVYETMTADPQAAVATILAALGHDPALAKTVSTGTKKMGGSGSAEWVKRFRDEHALDP